MNEITVLLRMLETNAFPFRVAISEGHDPEIGSVLEVHAFDVPEERSVAMSLEVTKLVRRAKLDRIVLSGAFDEVESASQADQLAPGAVWYQPVAQQFALRAIGYHMLASTVGSSGSWTKLVTTIARHATVDVAFASGPQVDLWSCAVELDTWTRHDQPPPSPVHSPSTTYSLAS